MTSNRVVLCTWGGTGDGLRGEVEEALTLGRKLSASLGVELNWLVLGAVSDKAVEAAGKYGVSGVDRIEDAKLDAFKPDAYVEALAQYWTQCSPKVLLFCQTFNARLIAPRLAGRLGTGVVMNTVGLDVEEGGGLRVTASAYGGDTRVVYELAGTQSYVVAVAANAVGPEPLAGAISRPTVRDVKVDLGSVEERIRVIEQSRSEGPRLEDAQVIVAGGRGLREKQNYKLIHELAEALGGMAAASRPIVDDGWIDSSRQIGLTGKITRPALYIGAGISGASQHMVGCTAAKTIVAINNDPDAAIFRYARYGIVGNCLEVLPELIRAVRA